MPQQQQNPIRSSPRRPGPASAAGTAGNSGQAGTGGGGGAGPTSNSGSIPTVAMASPKRKRSDHPGLADADSLNVSSAGGIVGFGSGGGANSMGIFAPHHHHGSAGITRSGRPALGKAASWDVAASSFNAEQASYYHDGHDHDDDDDDGFEHLHRSYHFGESGSTAVLTAVGHPPPSVRKARRRSSSGNGDGAGGSGACGDSSNAGAGGGGSLAMAGRQQQQGGGRRRRGSNDPAGGGVGTGRPSTAPAAMTPARSDGHGQPRLHVSSSSAAGGGGSGSGSGAHYWTRSKPYPPSQQQQLFLQQHQQQSLFSPGVGGPSPARTTSVGKPHPPLGKQQPQHQQHLNPTSSSHHEGDEHTASTRSINLSSDSSLLPGLTPMRDPSNRRDTGTGTSSGFCIGGDTQAQQQRWQQQQQQQRHDLGGAAVPTSPAAPFRFASFPASLPRVHAHPRTQPTTPGGTGTGGGFVPPGTTSGNKVERIDEAEAWTTAAASLNFGAFAATAGAGAGTSSTANSGAPPSSSSSAMHLRSSTSGALPPTHSAHRRPQSPNTSIDTMNDSTVSSISIDHGGGGGAGPQLSLHRQTRSDGTGASSPRGGRWLGDGDEENGDGTEGKSTGQSQQQQQHHEEDEEIGRTRLDFSTLLSPEPKTARKKGGSKQASLAAQTPFSFGRPSFGGDEDDAAIGHRIVDEGGVPLTPGAATLRFQLDEVTKCSPIPNGHREEAKTRGDVPTQPSLEERGNGPAFATRRRIIPLSQRKRSPTAADTKTVETRSPTKASRAELELSAVSGVTLSSSETSAVHGSLANGSQTTAATGASSQKTKARPRPDMSAFDGGGGDASPSADGMAIDPSSPHHTLHSASGHSGLVCPPTPQRTPKWAASDPPETGADGSGKRFSLDGAFGPPGQGGKLERANSLIANKLLAECPPQILDGLSSLESSLMDDANRSGVSSSTAGRTGPGAGASSFHGSGYVAASFSACTDNEGQYPPTSSQEAGGTIAENGPSPKVVAGSSGGGAMLNYDDAGGSSASPRCNLSLMDDMLDDEDGGGATSPNPRRVTEGVRSEAERTPHQSYQCRHPHIGNQISFSADYENLGQLGSGAFADVYKVRWKADGKLYAVKRNRRQFRGKRDRDRALEEVRVMQGLQATSAALQNGEKSFSKSTYCYLLLFIRAWQEDGYFFCQTELCSRHTCRQLMESLSRDWKFAKIAYPSVARNLPCPTGISPGGADAFGRLVPEPTIWKICHDVCAGLSHIHANGLVHQDVKPSNIFFLSHDRFGVVCKIGDFGMAGQIGVTEDGQEGDTAYMAPELLSTSPRHASADIFSLGLTIYELACARVGWRLPNNGQRWHDLRNGDQTPGLPPERGNELSKLIRRMINPDADGRPSAADILEGVHLVRKAETTVDQFLTDYVKDVDEFDKANEEQVNASQQVACEQRMTPTPPMYSVRAGVGSFRSGDSKSTSLDPDRSRSLSVRTPTPDSSMHMLHQGPGR